MRTGSPISVEEEEKDLLPQSIPALKAPTTYKTRNRKKTPKSEIRLSLHPSKESQKKNITDVELTQMLNSKEENGKTLKIGRIYSS